MEPENRKEEKKSSPPPPEMASSKVMASSKPRNSDPSSSSRSRRASSASSGAVAASNTPPPPTSTSTSTVTTPKPHQSDQLLFNTSSSSQSTMTVDGILRNIYASPSTESTLLDAQITLIETPPNPIETNHNGNLIINNDDDDNSNNQEMIDVIPQGNKTVDDVWREIVAGRKEMKEEPDEMMTLEDFLAKAGAVDVVGEDGDDDIKMPPPERLSGGLYAFDPVPPSAFQVLDKVEGSVAGYGNGLEVEVIAGAVGTAGGGGGGGSGGRGKRGRTVVMEPLDKAAQQRQRRMIKNRESAARSRERKQVREFFSFFPPCFRLMD